MSTWKLIIFSTLLATSYSFLLKAPQHPRRQAPNPTLTRIKIANTHNTTCKAFPGTSDWPSAHEWKELNETLHGVLLKPVPPASACYPGPLYDASKCNFLVYEAEDTHFWIDDPVTALTEWAEGDTCLLPLSNATTRGARCTQGGFPAYVINATTAEHVQAGVDFARRNNVRLVIKNTGHDFGGRSVGAGSLSIWTHYLKDFELIQNYTSAHGEYSGMAVRFGAGLEAFELSNHQYAHNIAVVTAGCDTVGPGGGWSAFGGHSTIISRYGLGSDQILELGVVTADGKFVIAAPDENEDLFWALRGGGGSTYGVIVSHVWKAYPSFNLTTTPTSAFAVGNGTNRVLSWLVPASPPVNTSDTDTFWEGVSTYYRFCSKIVEAGGICYTFVSPRGNDSYTLSENIQIPGMSTDQVKELTQPLYDDLNRRGINVTNIEGSSEPFNLPRNGTGDAPGAPRFSSRLIPRSHWDDDIAWNRTMLAIRRMVEAGYELHAIALGPSNEVAGWPGNNSSINTHWREALMHAVFFSRTWTRDISAEEARAQNERLEYYTDIVREATPDSGAYINEADIGEPNWQDSFFGDNYPRLLELKRIFDPENVFWAPTTPGSEGWEVRAVDDFPYSQNGRLCRVE